MKSDTQTITGSGAVTNPVAFIPIFSTGVLAPSFLALASGTLTYNIEVTGDDLNAPGYVAANGNWMPFTNMSGLTASAAGTLGSAVMGARAHITSGTGTLTFQFIQVTVY